MIHSFLSLLYVVQSFSITSNVIIGMKRKALMKKKVREKSRECHNYKPRPFPDTKRKRKPTNLNKHKPNKRTKSTKISALFPKRGNRNTKRAEKHKNKMTPGKTYNKSPRRINHKATRSKTNTGEVSELYFKESVFGKKMWRIFNVSTTAAWLGGNYINSTKFGI